MTRVLGVALVLLMSTMPVAADGVVLAFHQDRTHRVLRVDGHIDGQPAVFLVDTGATRSIVDAARIGISRNRLPTVARRNGPGVRSAGYMRAVNLELGERAWCDRPILAVDFTDFHKVYGKDVAGIIGQDLLTEFARVEIDYRRQRITMTD